MIIESLLDTDLYKLTMQQTVLHQFPGVMAEYRFVCRNPGIDFMPFMDEIKAEVDHLCSLRFKRDELEYLSKLRFMKPDYISYLRNFQLDRDHIRISGGLYGGECGDFEALDITISGPWVDTILFEVPVLAIVNEVYFRNQSKLRTQSLITGMHFLDEKIRLIQERAPKGFKFADFGTRRRFSHEWHAYVVKLFSDGVPNSFYGTSNVKIAMDYGLTPVGTMAHEYIQACQALVRLKDSQKHALQKWADEYRGDLGIALTDTLGLDAFLKDFDSYFAKLFDGVRHDSGDPYIWWAKVESNYRKLDIDPKTKIAVFSDGLDMEKALNIYKTFNGRMKMLFAIGTNLTNDVGFTPLNIVIKMTECDHQPVAKISDSTGKEMCRSEEYTKYIKSVFKIGG